MADTELLGMRWWVCQVESKERVECKATKNLGIINVSQGPYHREQTQMSHRTWNGTQELMELWGIVSEPPTQL